MRRPLVLLLLSAACVPLSFFVPDPDADRLLEREAGQLQVRVNDMARGLEERLKQHAGFNTAAGLDSSVGDRSPWLADEADDMGLAYWAWRGDSLVYWSANWPVNEDSLRAGRSAHLALPDGIALHARSMTDLEQHALLRVWQGYPFQNTYLQPSFAAWMGASKGLIAETGPGLGPVVRDAAGEVMFRLAWAEGVQPFSAWDAMRLLLLLIACALLVAACWSLCGSLSALRGRWTGLLVFAFAIIALRWASLLLYPLPPFDRLALFGPELYAASSWLPSLGDLVIDAMLMVVIARFAHITLRNAIVPSGIRAVMVGVLMMGILLWLGWWITDAFIGLVRDSSVDLDLFHLQELNLYSALALMGIALLFAGWVLIADAFTRTIVPRRRPGQIVLVLCLVTGVSVAVHDLIGVVDLILVLWPLPLLGMIVHGRRSRYRFLHALFSLVLLALLSAHVLIKYDQAREHRDRIALAERLLTEDDPVVELLFRQTAPRLRHDAAVYALLNDTAPCDPAELDALVRQPYFTGYWERYDVRLHAFGPDGTLRCATSPDPPRSLAVGEGFTRTLAAADMPDLFIDAAPGERPFYHAQVAVMASDTSPPAQLIVELHPRIAPEGQGFPELLLNDPEGISRRMGHYAFARYDKGILMEYRGFAFPMRWDRSSGEDRLAHVTLEGMDLLAYGDPRGSVVVLGAPLLSPLDRATTFSWLFGFFSLALAGAFGVREILRSRGMPRLGIGGKVRVALLAVAVLGLVVFGIGSQRSLARLYSARNDAALLEKTRSVLAELRHKLDGVDHLGASQADYLSHLLTQFSNVFFTDINLYAPEGRLIATSRPQVFDAGLLGRRMDARAFGRLAGEERTEFTHVERIGNARYRSAYMPLRNRQGALLAYVNLPSFARQGELDQERGTLVTAIVNLFVLLLALSLLAGVFISNWTTRPLEMLKRGLSRIALTGANEPIAYAGRDEVGDLVRVYNRKVNELQASAERLARSERESAWKEMARQVAHEIKNPLTPMKLSIQHFQRTWSPEVPEATEKLRRFGESLVQQIDALSRIAGEFSAFAQMPAAHETEFDLCEVAEAGIALFKGEANADISLQAHAPLMVKADREQLLRALNNLMKNALQSIPEGRRGKIDVALRREAGEAIIEVRDNGMGIPEDARARIFTPSFTTKSSGMGLGLAMVKRIVEQAGGRVWFDTRHDQGTAFFISLPPPG